MIIWVNIGESDLFVDRVIDDFIFLALMSGNDYFPTVTKFLKNWESYKNIKNKVQEYKNQYMISVSEKEIEVNWPLLNSVLGIKLSSYGNAREMKTQIQSDILPNPQDVIQIITRKCLGMAPSLFYSEESQTFSVVFETLGVVLSKDEPTKRDAYISALTSDELFNLLNTKKGISRELFDETLQEYSELVDKYIDKRNNIQTFETKYNGK
jgi:hypothetical protein